MEEVLRPEGALGIQKTWEGSEGSGGDWPRRGRKSRQDQRDPGTPPCTLHVNLSQFPEVPKP